MNNINISKYEDILNGLNNRLQILKNYSEIASKEEIASIKTMISEAKDLIDKSKQFNLIISKNKISEKDIKTLSNLSDKCS